MLYPFLAVPVLSRVTWVTFDSTLDLEINKIRNRFALEQIKRSRSELGWPSSITHHFHVRFSLPPASAWAASAYLRRAGHAEVAAAPTGGETDMGWISQASRSGNSWKSLTKKTRVSPWNKVWPGNILKFVRLNYLKIILHVQSSRVQSWPHWLCEVVLFREVPLRWSWMAWHCMTSSCLCTMTISFCR